MSKLFIAEFSHQAGVVSIAGQPLQLPSMPPAAGQVLTYSTTAASEAFGTNIAFVRLVSDADCHLEFGGEGVSATLNSVIKLTAGLPEYFGVTSGQKVAAIAA